MRTRYFDITFYFSLICSLMINTGMVSLVVLRTQTPGKLSFWKAHPVFQQAKATPEVVQDFPLPQDNPVLPQPKPRQLDNRDVFGETGGVGDSLNSSPGDQPLQGIKAEDVQAFLGRNNSGGGGGGGGGAQQIIGAEGPAEASAPRVNVPVPIPKQKPAQAQAVAKANPNAQANASKPPPEKTSKLDDKGTAQAKPDDLGLFGSETPQPLPAPKPVPAPQPAKVVAIAINPSPPTPAAQPTPPSPPAQSTSQSQQTESHQQQPPPGKPGPPGAPSDPAPPSDRESDPFAETNSFKFVNGRVTARNGRWVKTVKPRITDAGWNDMSFIADPSVTLLATVDGQGNVVHVVVYRSSGSEDIDLPCEEALNQWKIEPSKDTSGHTLQDVVSVTFGWVQ